MKKIIIGIFIVILVGIYQEIISYSGGAPAGYSGAPDEINCATTCHNSFSINSGSASFILNMSIPDTGVYQADSVYTGELVLIQNGINKFGFEITALTQSLQAAGSFIITDTIRTQLLNFSGRQYVTHTSSGNNNADTARWNFLWQAPSAFLGPITFYFAGNTANNDGSNQGDTIYVKNKTYSDTTSSLLDPSTVTQNPISIFTFYEKDQLLVRGYSLIPFNGSLQIYNLKGQIWYQETVALNANNNFYFKINVPNNLSGIHFLVFTGKDHKKLLTKKLSLTNY